ncbi:Zinc finger matrin-type protein 5 [Plakobranchus ocellatus]|uniref:Zinc finger matrin-type protein 5 n=1 Tax=Plakobranchus ocellatus TaxID=259542 RepID=A0AAV4BVA0_9GAST|nr:Zinc finger matrin-type protein 5 [Plakobranchus ocellatus]
MGKRYYCDYCKKSFADNPVSRKTHLNGVVHGQNKRSHYNALRDEEETLKDESSKRPCRSFLSAGDCKFGERCQYSHLTNEDKARLTEIVNKKKKLAEMKLQEGSREEDNSVLQSLNAWQSEKTAFQRESENGSIVRKASAIIFPDYRLASCFNTIVNPPPSLLPPTKEELRAAEYAEWG